MGLKVNYEYFYKHVYRYSNIGIDWYNQHFILIFKVIGSKFKVIINKYWYTCTEMVNFL